MKISGIAGSKHPQYKRGEVIPFSPEKKICLSAEEIVSKMTEEDYILIPLSSSILGDLKVITGRQGVKKSDSPQYLGKAVVSFKRLSKDGKRAAPGGTYTLDLHIQDSLDENGVPDVKTLSHKLVY